MLLKVIFLPHEFNHLTVCSRLENRQRCHNVLEVLKLGQTCTNKMFCCIYSTLLHARIKYSADLDQALILRCLSWSMLSF